MYCVVLMRVVLVRKNILLLIISPVLFLLDYIAFHYFAELKLTRHMVSPIRPPYCDKWGLVRDLTLLSTTRPTRDLYLCNAVDKEPYMYYAADEGPIHIHNLLKEIGTIKRFYSVYDVYYWLLHFIQPSVITKCGFIPEKRS